MSETTEWDYLSDELQTEIIGYQRRIKELEAENAAFRETLRDIAHGPVGYWNEQQHRAAVIQHMMQRAKEALDLNREVTK